MQYPSSSQPVRPVPFPEPTAWPGVELRHLVALQAVAAAGSFNAAAARLGYTQSAVSAQIRSLERLTGVRVLDRSRGARSLTLTKEGAILLKYATEIVAKFAAAADDLAGASRHDDGELRVGTFRSASLAVAAPAVARLAQSHPDVRVSLVELADDEALLELLADGGLELAFAVAPLRPGFESVVLRRESHVAVLSRGHELARKAEIRVADLAGNRVLVDTTRHGAHVAQAANEHGATTTIGDDVTVLVALAAAGLGIALVPELSYVACDGAVARPLVDLPERTIVLAWHGGRVRSVQAVQFAKVATDVAHASHALAS